MTKEKRLGRGLEALLSRVDEVAEPPIAPEQQESGTPLRVSVDLIDANPYQPRKEFGEAELAALAESLQDHGMLQPIVARRAGDRFQLVSGERRLKAARLAGWSEAPVFVREVTDRELAEFAIVENLQRADLNAIEKAACFRGYLDEYQCSQEELASRLKIDRSTVANLIRLLDLPEQVQKCVKQGLISQGHARAILALPNEQTQVEACDFIQLHGWSVRATEEYIREWREDREGIRLSLVTADDSPEKPKPQRSAHLADLEEQFRTALGAKVEVKQTTNGRGRIVIHFKGHDEFDRLRSNICDSQRSSIGRLG